jgi:hypothetical protein
LAEVSIVDRRLAQPDVVPTLKTTKIGIGLGLDVEKLINLMGKGQNYKNQNVENQKELRKLRRRSERRNGLFS